MTEELNNTQQEAEALAKEFEGKTPEELKAMEDAASKELSNRIYDDACTYIWNLMSFEGTYNREEYNDRMVKLAEKNKAEEIVPFTRLDDQMYFHNLTVLKQGYGNFGKEFVTKVLKDDPASAEVLFETAIQAYLDTTYEYESLISSLMTMSEDKKQETEKE